MLDERRLDRERYIEDVIATLKRELAAAGITAEVTGRPKHIYSIWNKMRRKQSGIDALYDIRAVRILVDDVKDCYAALGIVHHLWTPLPRRVRRLHREAEGQRLPLAAHRGDRPRGQAARGADPHLRDAPALRVRRRRALALQGGRRRRACAAIPRSRTGSRGCGRCSTGRTRSPTRREWLAGVQEQPVHRHDLRADAAGQGRRPAARRDAGRLRLRGAHEPRPPLPRRAVDGAMVPLNHALQNGQRVEIVTAKQGGPSRDWLNPELGYVHSHRARDQGAAVVQGAAARGDASRRAARSSSASCSAPARRRVNLDAVAARPGFDKADELFAAVARDEINLRQCRRRSAARGAAGARCPSGAEPEVVARAEQGRRRGQRHPRRRRRPADDAASRAAASRRRPTRSSASSRAARASRSTAQSCANVARMRAREPERLIAADWGAPRDEVFPVDIVRRGDATGRACCATSPKSSRARRSTSPRRTR